MSIIANEETFIAMEDFCSTYPRISIMLTDAHGKPLYIAGNDLAAGKTSKVSDFLKRQRGKTGGYLIKAEIFYLDDVVGMLNLNGTDLAAKPELNYVLGILAEKITANLELKRLSSELERQRRYQDAIAEAVSDGLLLVSKDGTIDFINSIGARILGVNREWATGRPVEDLVEFRPVVLDVLKKGKGYTDKEFVLKGAKKTFHFMKTAVPILDDNGQVACVVDTFREIRKVQRMVTSMSGLSARFTFDDIIGDSAAMKECIRMARVAAQSSSNVLIQGESGTGKELLAQAIHNASSLKEGPFVAVNCAAIPRELIESELFGYEEGAFTGAVKGGRPGKFELANDGTIFLDEIGDMPLDMQVKLLRVIQEKKVMRIGGHHIFNFNGRIIAASNRDLQKDVMDGTFRRDLFYRLNVLTVFVSSLRERKEDIKPTVHHILGKICTKLGIDIPIVQVETFQALEAYDWPGNVRELENVLERAINIAPGKQITISELPKHLVFNPLLKYEPATVVKTLEEIEQETIKTVLDDLEWNISQAAMLLGVTRNTLYNKIKKYGINKYISL